MKSLISHTNEGGYFQYRQMGSGTERQMEQRMAQLSGKIQSGGYEAKTGKMSDGSEYVRHIHGRQVITLFIVDEERARMILN